MRSTTARPAALPWPGTPISQSMGIAQVPQSGGVRIFVCKAKSLPAGQAFDPISAMGLYEAILVEDRELVHGGFPVVRGATLTCR